MRSIGTRIGLWVLGLPAFGIFSLLVALYSYAGPSFVTQVIPWAISGTGALVFLWQGMKSSATKKLDFLNEYAFSPLRNMVAIDEPARARNSLAARKTGEILEILKSNGKYLLLDRKSTRLNSSHLVISYAVFCLKKKNNHITDDILPALRKAGVTEDQIDQMLVRNPRIIFEARTTVQA